MWYRLKEASLKKKKIFKTKSSGQKDEKKYYEMLIRNTEALFRKAWLWNFFPDYLNFNLWNMLQEIANRNFLFLTTTVGLSDLEPI